MARLQLIKNGGSAATLISNSFIENYMPKANPTFAMIYILAYKRLSNGAHVETKDLAETFRLLESDVINAWNYWEREGLVTITATDPDSMGITFIEPPQKEPEKEKKETRKPNGFSEKTDYSVQELEYYQSQSDEIKNLFSHAEQAFGRTLKYTDLNLLYGLHDWLKLPVPVILKLITHCCESGKKSMNYIETVAVNWRDEGIETEAAADEFINAFNKDYRSILRAFGQQSRNPAPKETEFMKRWLGELNMPLEIILEACDKTMMALGKPNFKYADAIVAKWSENGVKNLGDINKLEEDFTQIKTAKTRRAAPKKKERFANFEGRPIDFNELEKMERDHINDMVAASGSE